LNASAAAAARAQAQAEAEAEADAYSNAELARDMELDLVQDYLVYVKWNGTLSLSKANHEVPVRVQATYVSFPTTPQTSASNDLNLRHIV